MGLDYRSVIAAKTWAQTSFAESECLAGNVVLWGFFSTPTQNAIQVLWLLFGKIDSQCPAIREMLSWVVDTHIILSAPMFDTFLLPLCGLAEVEGVARGRGRTRDGEIGKEREREKNCLMACPLPTPPPLALHNEGMGAVLCPDKAVIPRSIQKDPCRYGANQDPIVLALPQAHTSHRLFHSSFYCFYFLFFLL